MTDRLKSADELVGDILLKKTSKGSPGNYWQERALYFTEKLRIPETDRRIIFRYFKRNLAIMESICSFVLDSATPIRNPTAYILAEYKRRGQS